MMVELVGTINRMEAWGDKNGYVKIWFAGSDAPITIAKDLYKDIGSPPGGAVLKITITPMEEV